MKNIYRTSVLILLSSILFFSCNNKNEETSEEIQEVIENIDSELIITKEQFAASEMKLGTSVMHTFENQINVSGLITVSPKGKARINTPIAGIIKSNPYSTGQYVKRGQTLFTLESNEIIMLQQEYAENKSLLTASESEYNRQKKLFNDGVTSEKNFVKTESSFKSLKAKCSGLKARLRVLNINAEKVESGNIVSRIGIYAPISGYITMQNGILGQYAEPQSNLMEIVNVNQLYLKLFPFEKDIHYLKIGQTLSFYVPGNKNTSFKAELATVGKSVNQETKAIECIAKLDQKDMQSFINDTFVEVAITTESKNTKALANSAIIKSGDDFFILVKTNETKENYVFEKIKLNIGLKTNDFSEILTDIKEKEVLIKGAYNIVE